MLKHIHCFGECKGIEDLKYLSYIEGIKIKVMDKKFNFSAVTYQFRGSYVQTIFDPVQTHALYGVSKTQKDEAKEALKKIGAKRFRIVSTKHGVVIICFKIK